MKKTSSDIGLSSVWEAVLALSEGKQVDLNVFSPEEQIEIQESHSIIKAIESSQEDIPHPSKASFNEMLFQLSEEASSKQKNDWKTFFRRWKVSTKQWVAIPILGLLAITIVSVQNQSSVKLAEAETLSLEIQNDIQEFSRDFEEIESLKRELDIVWVEGKNNLNT